ncbi:MAG: peptidase and in kexin sedolisin [Thermoleophilia bacterium]|nr:peptidase and in kexin sedolisin [Thermoleophilia bacterium]
MEPRNRLRLLTGLVAAAAATLYVAAPSPAAAPGDDAPVRIVVVGEASSTDLGVRTLTTPADELRDTLRELRADPDNELVEVDARRFPSNTAPTDTFFAQQWNLPAVNWPYTANTLPAAPVAVIDAGFDLNHPDLRTAAGTSRFSGVWNATDNSSNVADYVGHGTAVASITAATTNDAYGIAGVASAAPLLGIKIADARGLMFVSAEIKAIRWAVANGARVINLSLGSGDSSEAEQLAIREAVAAGVVVVAATGNDGCGRNVRQFPSAYPEVVAVGATAPDGTVPCFSNTGDHLDFVAPGQSIVTDSPGGEFTTRDGTSFAAPHVAGALALVLGAHPGWSASQARGALQVSSRDVGATGWDVRAGNGLIDVQAALAVTNPPGTPMPIPAPAPTPAPDAGAVEPVPDAGGAAAAAQAAAAPIDRYEPNGDLRRAKQLRTALDLRRVRARSFLASASRATDPVDIYPIMLPRNARVVRAALSTRTNPRAVFRIDVYTTTRNGQLRVLCSNVTGRVAVACRTAGASRVWVRVTARFGGSSYRFRAAA